MNSRMGRKTERFAIGGLCLALTVASLVAASLVPGVEMTCYGLAGLFSGIIIMESGLKGGLLVYMGALLLSFVLVPNKFAILPYGLFFGLYGFVKYFAEKIKNAPLQITVKVVFFTAISAASLYFFKGLLLGNIQIPEAPMILLIAAGVAMFILYDYIFTLAVNIYRKRIKRENINFKLSGDKDGNEEGQSK